MPLLVFPLIPKGSKKERKFGKKTFPSFNLNLNSLGKYFFKASKGI